MKLSVLISTIDSGIDNLKNILLSPRHDVEYIISHQFTDEKYIYIPAYLIRDDIIISQIPGKGLSRSRNNAIKHAPGDIALIADDDVRYKPEYFDRVIEAYRDNDVDVACFKIKTPDGEQEYKAYPNKQFKIADFDTYSPSSIELTFKLDVIRRNKIQFDERFGLGTFIPAGEENIFIKQCIRKNLNIRFFPEFIVEHPYDSTTKILPKNHVDRIKVSAGYDYYDYGILSIFKIILSAIKNRGRIKKRGINTGFYILIKMRVVLTLLFNKSKYVE